MRFVKIVVLASSLAVSGVGASGIPTVDVLANLKQALSYIEDLSQSAMQNTQLINEAMMIQQQIRQIELRIENMQRLNVFRRQDQMAILNEIEILARHAQSLAFPSGNMQGQIEEGYRGPGRYREMPDEELTEAAVERRERHAEDAANLAKTSAGVVDKSYEDLKQDAVTFEDLQGDIESADGDLKAAQASGQMEGFTASQLMEIRMLMLNQQQLEIQRRAEEADDMALSEEQRKRLFEGLGENSTAKYGTVPGPDLTP